MDRYATHERTNWRPAMRLPYKAGITAEIYARPDSNAGNALGKLGDASRSIADSDDKAA